MDVVQLLVCLPSSHKALRLMPSSESHWAWGTYLLSQHLEGGDMSLDHPWPHGEFEANLASRIFLCSKTTKTDGRLPVSPVSWLDSGASQRLRCPRREESSLRRC